MKKTTQNTASTTSPATNRLESVGDQFRHKSNIMRCELIMDAARKNAVIMNGQLVANIPIDLLFVDESYQREIKGTRSSTILKIAHGFDYAKAGLILASFRADKGMFAVIDGHGRYEAAKISGKMTVMATIYESISVSKEAELFMNQDDNKVRVTDHAKFCAGIVASREIEGYDEYPELARIMKANGVTNPAHVSAIKEALRVTKKDPIEAEWIFNTIRKANWHDTKAGYSQYVMKALSIIYEEQPELKDNVKARLIPAMKSTSPIYFASAATLLGNPRLTKFRNVADIMIKILGGDKDTIQQLNMITSAANS